MGTRPGRTGFEIAVVGMAGRFPGADSTDALWECLRVGTDAITRFTRDELEIAGVDSAVIDDPHYIRARGVLEAAECFDAPFFGYSPREARLMDPQHRLFLECAWTALEDGGCVPRAEGQAIGVFSAAGFPSYLLNLHTRRGERGFFDTAEILLGNEKDHIATRVAYKLDLTGPAMAIQTACSSSLVAVHQACRSLLAGDCDGALAGGVYVAVPQLRGYLCEEGGVLSRDGRCRAFDAEASGFVPGSGVGVVFLKRLEDAEADRDPIRAVILGSGVNNDGAAKAGYTAPSVSKQADAIRSAYTFAEVDPATVGYVEAHGAGTELGDPIEVEALTRAFGNRQSGQEWCRIGSVKTNLGHLDAAAGVTGLIKAILCVERGEIPPSLNFKKPNPRINFSETPFRVASHLLEWEEPRRAGVSSLGLGGTNAHVVLASYPATDEEPSGRARFLIPISGASATSCRGNAGKLRDHLARQASKSLDDVAYTMQVGRLAMDHRTSVVADCTSNAVDALTTSASSEFALDQADGQRDVVFMFPGGAAQHVGMARETLAHEPCFRDWVDACCDRFEGEPGIDLTGVFSVSPTRDTAQRLSTPTTGLAALFTVEIALAQMWRGWGIEPAALIGHSLGEYSAAFVAGVLSFEDAISLVALRARLFESLPPGAMLSVQASVDDLAESLGRDLSVAAVNGPNLCTVAGPRDAILELQKELTRRETMARALPINTASHCELVEPMLAPLAEFLGSIHLAPPAIPYVSNLTGGWITAAEVQSPSYWTDHIRNTVKFSQGLATVLSERRCMLLEVGPGQSLTGLARNHPDLIGGDTPVISSLPHATDDSSDHQHMLESLGRMWSVGVPVDWDGFQTKPRRRVSIPTYCFDRHRYWVDAARLLTEPVLTRNQLSSWFYLPGFLPILFSRSPADNELADRDCVWLVFADETELEDGLCDRLKRAGAPVIRVRQGDTYEAGDEFRLNPGEPDHYVAAIRDSLARTRAHTVKVIHLWQYGDPVMAGAGGASFAHCQRTGYYSVVYLCRAIIASECESAHLTIFASGLFNVSGSEVVAPERSTLLGPCTVAHQEAPHISCRVVDLPFPPCASMDELVETAVGEASDTSEHSVVAHRTGSRLARAFSPVVLKESPPEESGFKHLGNYLLAGGLGPIGLRIARHLAERYQGRISFVVRTPLPPRDTWADFIADGAPGDETCHRIRAIEDIERAGAEVRIFEADLCEHDEMHEVVRSIESEWGPLDGVVHCASESRHSEVNRWIDTLGRAETEPQFGAKVRGLHTLARLFEDKPLGFCVVFSSGSSILGGLGLTAYSAANLFADAFCSTMRARGLPWTSVNWDAWRLETPGSGTAGAVPEFGITPEEGVEALERIVSAAHVGQVVVSTVDVNHRLQTWHLKTPVEQDHSTQVADFGAISPKRQGATSADPLPPRNAVEEVLVEIWGDLLGIERIGVRDNFFEIGGHSLLAVHLRTEVRRRLGLDLPLEAVFRSGTVEGMAAALESDPASSSEYHALVPLRTTGSNPPFFCVHAASGAARIYEPLCHHLGEDQPFYAFEARGFDDRQPPFAHMDEMVSAYLDELVVRQPTGPYHVGGWCAGAAIAYEISQRLLRGGHQVHLAIMDFDRPNEPTPEDDARDLFSIARTHARNLGVDLPLRRDDLAGLPTDEQLQYVFDQYKLFGVVPGNTTIESLQIQWNVFLSVLRIVRDYRFEPYSGHVALFQAEELDYHRLVDHEVAPDFALNDEMRAEFENRSQAWRGLTPHPVEVFTVPGYHSTLALEPNVETLADSLLKWIESTVGRHPS